MLQPSAWWGLLLLQPSGPHPGHVDPLLLPPCYCRLADPLLGGPPPPSACPLGPPLLPPKPPATPTTPTGPDQPAEGEEYPGCAAGGPQATQGKQHRRDRSRGRGSRPPWPWARGPDVGHGRGPPRLRVRRPGCPLLLVPHHDYCRDAVGQQQWLTRQGSQLPHTVKEQGARGGEGGAVAYDVQVTSHTRMHTHIHTHTHTHTHTHRH